MVTSGDSWMISFEMVPPGMTPPGFLRKVSTPHTNSHMGMKDMGGYHAMVFC